MPGTSAGLQDAGVKCVRSVTQYLRKPTILRGHPLHSNRICFKQKKMAFQDTSVPKKRFLCYFPELATHLTLKIMTEGRRTAQGPFSLLTKNLSRKLLLESARVRT